MRRLLLAGIALALALAWSWSADAARERRRGRLEILAPRGIWVRASPPHTQPHEGRTPFRVSLSPGRYTVIHPDGRRSVIVGEGKTTRLTLPGTKP